MNTIADHKTLLLSVHEQLQLLYGQTFPFFSSKEPISQLVSALLSHRTRNPVSRDAYHALREGYDSWQAVMEAPTEAVEQTIRMVTYPEQKAPRIQKALRLVKERTGGALSLDFLAALTVSEARAWLEDIPGVGAKTSAAILNFSRLRMAALVVDTHHLRVMQRVGILSPKANSAKAPYYLQSLLPKQWSAQQVYDHHQLIMRHGQRMCYYRAPRCEHCPLQVDCQYFSKNRQGK